jgi:RNA polymerase sigma-70 factor (ECF subfamily)
MTLVTSRAEAGEEGGYDRLGELYARYISDARRFAYLLCGDEQAAADIAQDAFVRVASRLGALRNADAFPAYLRVTVRNLVRMRARASAREADRLLRHRRMTPDAENQSRDQLIQGADLWLALSGLPERQRTALVCRFYLDLSERETARILSCRPGTVKSLVSRGLATMRENGSLDEFDG